MPGIAVAVRLVELLFLAVVDGEVECLGALATCGGQCVEGVGAALSISGSVPSVAVAVCLVVFLAFADVDGEV